jgi:hypothetical protein
MLKALIHHIELAQRRDYGWHPEHSVEMIEEAGALDDRIFRLEARIRNLEEVLDTLLGIDEITQ